MRSLLLLAAMVAIAGCAIQRTYYTESETEIRLLYGGGGRLSEKRLLYEPLYTTEKKVIIDGMMVSADAFYAFGIPGVCYTERAVWSPHAVSAGGLYRLGRMTDNIMLYLPEPMSERFRASAFYWIHFTVRDIGYAELLTIWPEGACDQDDVERVAAAD